ncbi:MAG: ABC transporter substrate-binding protein [Anaerolineales bacterium]|nr:MAG: ABC transporter substrate-binding protein [Anaerolineales bacterium]
MFQARRAVLVFTCLAAALAACQPLPAVSLATPVRLPTNTPFAFSSLYGQLAPTYTPTPQAELEPTATQPPALSGESIPIHLFCTQSSPLGELAAARAAAFEAAVAAHNAAGGIQGAQMALQVTDIGAAEDPAELAGDALAASGAPLAVLCDAASEAALAELLTQRRTPAIALGALAERRGGLYGIEPPPSQALAYLLRTLKTNWGTVKPTGASSTLRLAVLNWPEAYAGIAVSDELAAYAEEQRIELVYQAEYEPRHDLNVYDSLFALRDEHANLIFVNADSYGLAQVLNALSHLGVRSRVVVATPAAAYEPVLYTYLADPAFAEGLYIVSAWDYTPQNWEQLHMHAALALAEDALARALDAGGGPQALTPAAVAQALQAAPFGPLDFAGGARWPAQLALWQVGAAPGQLTRVAEPAALPDLP